MPISDVDLLELVSSNNYLDEKDLLKVKQKAKESNISYYEAIVELDLISDENLGQLIADHLKLPFINLSKSQIDKKSLLILSEEVATRNNTIVFEYSPDLTKVATSDPDNSLFLGYLEQKIGTKVKLFFATQRDVQRALGMYKGDLQNSFDELIEKQAKVTGIEKSELSVTKLVDMLVEYAYTYRASDLHIEPDDEKVVIRFRIDGILHDVLKLDKSMSEQVVSRIKVLSKLRTDEHMSPQDGKMRIKLKSEELDIRVSIVPIVEGEKVVMRLLSSKSRQYGLSDLGITQADLKKIKDGFARPYGMVLSTGPTGSGKTTTMYSIIKILNTRDRNIATIEDPVEYEIGGTNQIQVNPKAELTFANGLRSILRQDPDVIFVGEIRDKETADIAINSALTGHLVLSTLHTNNASTAFPRLYDMDVEPFLISSTVSVVVGQRLVRRICEKCKISEEIEISELERYFDKDLVAKYYPKVAAVRTYKGKGCTICQNTGYLGRVGLFEVLNVSDEIQKMITKKADSASIQKQAVSEGMITIEEDGVSKVQQGVTTIEEVLRAMKE